MLQGEESPVAGAGMLLVLGTQSTGLCEVEGEFEPCFMHWPLWWRRS
jgi:hypothetical protein